MACNTAAITFLEPRKVVRIIGREENIPLLSAVSEKGFVKEVNDSKLVIDLDGSIAAERPSQQLSDVAFLVMIIALIPFPWALFLRSST